MSITVQGLTKSFGDTTAVDSLDFELAAGEFMVLLGPSGCGKTTTMRCIAGLETPTSGRIALSGEVVYDSATGIKVPANKRNVGMVFQSYAIWPHMTVAQNVGYSLRVQGKPKGSIRARVEEVLELVGLAGLGDRNASLLSGGQMQRVAVARSITMEPRVLLFDEPLSNLDAKLRDRLRLELRLLQQRLGITALYVTHDQSEALALADRVAVMEAGRFVQVAPPAELYRSPNSVFVADFIGASNLIQGSVVSNNGKPTAAVRPVGSSITIESSMQAPSSTEIRVCIRRESINVLTDHVTGPNVWPATVTASIFMGDHVSYVLDVSGIELHVDSYTDELPLPAGTNVFAKVTPERVLLLDNGT